MPSDPPAPLILGFDTSGPYCAAALMRGDTLLGACAQSMPRGQAEYLMPMIQGLMRDHGVDWPDLKAIGVGIGPGNFTGIRIAVSAARGLALGLEAPAYGVSGFEARAACGAGLPNVPAPRDHLYLRDANGKVALMPRAQAEQVAQDAGQTLLPEPDPQDLAIAIARIAASRWPERADPPAPLYLKPADAAPSSDVPPVLLDP